MSRGGPRRAVAVDVVRQPNPLAAVKGDSTVPTRILPVIPLEGRQLISHSTPFEFILEGSIQIVEFVVDIPEDVDADVFADGSPVLSVRDRDGLVGTFRVGDYSGNAHLSAEQIRVKGRNQGNKARDVRVWVVVVT